MTQTPVPAEVPTPPSDLQDERLIRPVGVRENLAAQIKRIRTGDLGAFPIIAGLILICIIFEIVTQATFLNATTLSTIVFLYCAPVGVISVGIVLVLLLGQIDLSVGSMSGASAAIFTVVYTTGKLPEWECIIASLVAGCLVGLFYGFLFVKFAVPSFVVTLAGLLSLLGLQLLVLGPTGDVIMPQTSFIVQLGQAWYLPWYIAYLLAIIAAGGYAVTALLRSRSRNRAGLSVPSSTGVYIRAALMLVGLVVLITYLDPPNSPLGGFGLPVQQDGFGISTAFTFLVVLVIVVNYALTRTRWGRSVFAVGGMSRRHVALVFGSTGSTFRFSSFVHSWPHSAVSWRSDSSALQRCPPVQITSTSTRSQQRSSVVPACSVAAGPRGPLCSEFSLSK